MTLNPLLVRRLLVRFALLFAVAQIIVVGGGLLMAPNLRPQALGLVLVAFLIVADLALLTVFASWLLRGPAPQDPLGDPVRDLARDVHRIADGDYRHRVGEPDRAELRQLRDSVNRLADRLIADQRHLGENIRSLEETNRELVVVRDQMVHSARLASVGTLAAGIAHEVGNPLGAVMAFVDVAKARAERAGTDTEILDSIRGEAQRIDRIVRGLLDYARPRDADAPPAPASEVLSGVRELLESQGKLTTVDVEWEVVDDAPALVAGPHRLEQVLVNLLLNAVDALEGVSDPKITVRLRAEDGEMTRLRPRREDDPPGINYLHRRRMADAEDGIRLLTSAQRVTVIEVLDNGPGIAPEHLEHVFDPFFTTKEPGKGTGLGLSICARLIEGMGGHIDVTSPKGEGARFLIRLPSISDQDSSTVEIDEAQEAH